eukprot:TRINITY_DN2408_c0_g2_i1.p1 TRINITY_DN2408_c0_g2~~TRINITY_DN2408_c0_g2_i1.p1  ORF type:complete len:1215 (-),score=220.51 TRINITY_DN2408_c0_g2_i1:192-3836(-)
MALLLSEEEEELLIANLSQENETNTSSFTPYVANDSTWDEMWQHTFLCLAVWLGAYFFSFTFGSTRRLWHKEWMSEVLSQYVMYLKSQAYWNYLNASLQIGICLLYVARSEKMEVQPIWQVVEITGIIFYAMEATLNWMHFTSAGIDGIQNFFKTYMSIVCIEVPSVAMRSIMGQPSHLSFGFIASMRVAQIFNQFIRQKGEKRISLEEWCATYGLTFLTMFFSVAMLIREMETLQGVEPNILDGSEPQLGQDAPTHERWTVFASAYMMFINTCKTGYGDMLPRSIIGQTIAFAGTALCVYLVMRVMLRVLQGYELGGDTSPSYDVHGNKRHIIVAGTSCFQMLREFLAEVYHDDYHKQSEDLNTVILFLPGQRKVIEQLSTYLSQPTLYRLQNRVWMVEGSALREEDLDRVKYKTCHCAFILPNIYSQDPEKEDCGNIMRALTMKRHTPYVRIVCMSMKADSLGPLLSVGMPESDIICCEDVVLGILGKGAEVQGFASFASSFLKTSLNFDPMDIHNALNQGKDQTLRWLEDYASGLNSTTAEVSLSSAYVGVPFSQAAVDISQRSNYKAYLIGLVEEPLYPCDVTNYILFPNKYYRIGTAADRNVKGIIMCKTPKDIKQHPPGRVLKWTHHSFLEVEVNQDAQNNPRLAASKAGKGHEGWVRDFWTERNDKLAYMNEEIGIIAKRRSAQGLQNRTKLSRVQIEELLEDDAPELFQINSDLEALAEDPTTELMQDPLERALILTGIKAQQQAALEKEELENQALEDIDFGEGASLRLAVSEIFRVEDTLQKKKDMDPILKEEDNALWGGQPAPVEEFWANPRDTPEEVLVQGDHIILISLESDLTDLEPEPEKDAIASGERKPMRPGRKLNLKLFLHSIRVQTKKRNIVVVSHHVPLDWGEYKNDPFLHLVLGEPLSPMTLERAGYLQAKSIIIHQRDVAKGADASLVDSKGVFALRLVEALLLDARKLFSIPVLIHIHLEENTVLMTATSEPPKAKGLLEILEEQKAEQAGENDDEPSNKMIEETEQVKLQLQQRFSCGVLSCTSMMVTLAANSLYAPSLPAIMSEMARSSFVVVPVPNAWNGLTFGELYDFLLRKRNLLPLALLRKTTSQGTIDFLDAALESRKVADPDAPLETLFPKVAALAEAMRRLLSDDEQQKFRKGGYTFERYTLVMPLGVSFVIFNDGVLCMQPTTRVTQPKTGMPRERKDEFPS